MKWFSITLIVLGFWGTIFPAPSAAEKPVVEYPTEGEVLQGSVAIRGNTDLLGFQSAEVLFGYEGDPTETWFFLNKSETPAKGDVLAIWDTSNITDGNYQLMVRVYLEDGPPVETVVSGLRVRNYLPVETSTPAPTLDPEQLQETEQFLVQSGTASPTDLSDNPAQVTTTTLFGSILKGMLYAVLGLAVVGGLLFIWTRIRNS